MTLDLDQAKIVVVGSTMIDLMAYTSRIPESGETVVGERFEMGFGGKGANQAVMARLLGTDVIMVGCLGDDTYGDMTIENFAAFDIDTSDIYRASGPSGVAPIWVEPDGSNRIIIFPGANERLTAEQAVRSVRRASDAAIVVGQLEVPQQATAAAFRAAREMGAATVLNPAPAAPLSSDLLEVSDWLIPNEVEFEMLAGRSALSDEAILQYARSAGRRLVVTLGEHGAALVTADGGGVTRIPAPAVAAVDTTGAGDAFVGSFVVALALGLDDHEAVRFANHSAADTVTRHGTQSSFPRQFRNGPRQAISEILPASG